MSDKNFAPTRNKFWLHSGHTIGETGFCFNRPSCKLCRVFDGTVNRYCTHCFLELLGINGIRGAADRRRRIGGIVRRARKLYTADVSE